MPSAFPFLAFPMSTPRHHRTLLTAALLAAATFTAPVLAQGPSGGTKKKDAQPLIAPVPPIGKSDTPWMPYGVAILLAGLIIGANFIPSKRGHQD
jgi:hypothetical protein